MNGKVNTHSFSVRKEHFSRHKGTLIVRRGIF